MIPLGLSGCHVETMCKTFDYQPGGSDSKVILRVISVTVHSLWSEAQLVRAATLGCGFGRTMMLDMGAQGEAKQLSQ